MNRGLQVKAKFESYLGQFVYGAIDGSVTTFAIVAGAAGANLSNNIIIILGIANLVADGFSMGASAYLSAKSKRDLRKRDNDQHDHDHGETPVGDGLATFIAFVIVGFIPVLVYVIAAILGLPESDGLFAVAAFITAAVFMSIGVLKAGVTKTNPLIEGLETLLLGGIAAGLAYLLGNVLAKALGA
jgi:VIT1/CCC1 family predicted Fe2+/Mn2+ transporter